MLEVTRVPPPYPLDALARPRSIRPTSPVSLTLAQAIAVCIALVGFGCTVGAIYPRLAALEEVQGKQAQTIQKTSENLARVSAIVERMENTR